MHHAAVRGSRCHQGDLHQSQRAASLGRHTARALVFVRPENDILCKQDLAAQKPELASKLAAAYDQWWDTLFPTMIQLGGDKGEPDSLKKGQVEK